LKRAKRLATWLLVLVIAVSLLSGCGSKQSKPEEPSDKASSGEQANGEARSSDEAASKLRVAVAFPGSIKDMGWNQSGYEALMEAKDRFGVEVSYQESVGKAEVKDVLRNYAADGYDLVIGHDLYFTDPVLEVAQEFPDVLFGISGGTKGADNVVSMTATNWENTYLAGTLAGLMTKSNTIGILTATDSPIALRMVQGFKNGATAQNPSAKIIHAYVGSWDDVVKGKELVRSMVQQGADIIYTQAGQVNVGAIEACKEAGVYAIGAIRDMWDVAPDTVISSAMSPPGALITNMIKQLTEGALKGGTYVLGVKDGAEDLAPYHNFEDKIPEEVKKKVAEVRQALIDGKIEPPKLENK